MADGARTDTPYRNRRISRVLPEKEFIGETYALLDKLEAV